jgi:hypothetical protein
VPRRAIKTERAPVSSTPRAKSIAPADRALDQYAEAAQAFDALCEERGGLGGIDTKYANLAEAAAKAIKSLLTQPRAPATGFPSEALKQLLEDYARERRRVGDSPEDDIRVAEIALREVSGRRTSS